MSIMLFLPLFWAISLAQIVPFNPILPVLTSPVLQSRAEEELHYQLVNVRNTTCQATLTFDNATFLPISAIANPKNCAGNQLATFRIPGSVPNGAAAMEWQCVGVDGTVIDLMMISGGSGDVEQFAIDSEALDIVVQCLANSTAPEYAPSVTSCI